MSKKIVKKAPAKKSDDDNAADSPQLDATMEAPVEDPGRAPVTGPENIGYKERRGEVEDPNAQPEKEDRVWSVASRARWGDKDATAHKLGQESAEVERMVAKSEQE
jgi:hypothetical protein